MKKILCFLLASFLLTTSASALEVVRQKNVATYIVFPMIDSTDDVSLKSSATSLDSEIDAFADGTAPDGFADCTNEATEIGSTGQYYLSLTQSEMNNDYIIIQVKASDANTQTILVRTMVGDPLMNCTTDDGGAINVTSGKIDEVSALTGNTAQTGDAYAVVTNGTYGNSAIENLVDDLESRLTATRAGYLDNLTNLDATVSSRLASANITLSSGKVTVGTNDDKTGYSISGTTTTLDALKTYGDSNWLTATGFSTHSAADVWAVGTRALTDKAGFTISGTYTTLDALSTHGDSTWATATGFSTHSAADVVTALGTGTTLTAVPWNSSWDAEVQSECADALAAFWTSPATLVDSIWDEVQSGHTSAGTFGKYLDTEVSGVGGGSAPTAAEIADAVWDETQSDHVTTGTTGKSLNNASSAGDPWDTDISSGYSGKAGEYIRSTYQSTNGSKDGGVYNGIEDMIRRIR